MSILRYIGIVELCDRKMEIERSPLQCCQYNVQTLSYCGTAFCMNNQSQHPFVIRFIFQFVASRILLPYAEISGRLCSSA